MVNRMKFENVKKLDDLYKFLKYREFVIQKHNKYLMQIDRSHFLQIKIVDTLNSEIASKEHRLFRKQFRDIPFQLLIDKNFQRFVFHRDYGTPIRFTYNRSKGYAKDTEKSILKKINKLCFEDSDFNTSINSLFDVKEIVQKFYLEYKSIKSDLARAIKGYDGDHLFYAQIILDRVIFIYFLQSKGLIDNNYLAKLYFRKEKIENYYKQYLIPLFFDLLNSEKHSKELVDKFGTIPYLNGGLFAPKEMEVSRTKISIANDVWKTIFSLLNSYEWVIEEEKGDSTTLTPSIIGYIYEKSVIALTQKETGSYYTPEEITNYISKNTIHPYITDRVNKEFNESYDDIWENLLEKEEHLKEEIDHIQFIYFDVLKKIKICDNACGSGAFLIAAQQILLELNRKCIDKLKEHTLFVDELQILNKHFNWNYYIKRNIITKNLFGVDIQKGAIEIAKLRLWLSMVSEMDISIENIEPLPNIDYNIISGDSLIGYINLPKGWGHSILSDPKIIAGLLREREALIAKYREAKSYDKAIELKVEISKINDQIKTELNTQLDNEIHKKKIIDSDLKDDYFHWGFEFFNIFSNDDPEEIGFDLVIGNPPWNAVKPVEKEFFSDYDSRLTKYGVDKQEARSIIRTLLKNKKIEKKWLKYKRKIAFQIDYYKKIGTYNYQIDFINNRRMGGDYNYYKLFLERSYQLIKPNGFLGYIIPSGFHTDAGTKGLRRLFFDKGQIRSLCGFENKKGIFTGVHKSFKFDVIIFKKSDTTKSFNALFMQHDVLVLNNFKQSSLKIDWLITKEYSPFSMSIVEYKSLKDKEIIEKMHAHEILYENNWLGNAKLFTEFHMTSDRKRFNTMKKGFILYEGKMIEQFTPYFESNKYWISKKPAFEKLYKNKNKDYHLDYEYHRLGFRSVASSTNRRSMIASLLPREIFCGNSLSLFRNFNDENIRLIEEDKLIYMCGILNSFAFDYLLRLQITTNLNFFFIYQMPIPSTKKTELNEMISYVLKLTENAKEFSTLRNKYNIKGKTLSDKEKWQIIANINIIAGKLYGLNKKDMEHIMDTFHQSNLEKEKEIRNIEKLILEDYD